MRLIVLAFIAFCSQERGLLMTQDKCNQWLKDCYVYLRASYDDDYNPANRCLVLYDDIFTAKEQDRFGYENNK